ncbi:MAG: hypothetical protein ACRCVN_03285 [Spirochaetia bacterium]
MSDQMHTPRRPSSSHNESPQPTDGSVSLASRDSYKATFIITLFMSNFLANVLLLALLILLPLIKFDLKLNYIAISWIFTFLLCTTEVGHIISHKLTHRLSIFHLFLFTNFSLIFACLILAFSTNLFGLLLGITIMCIARSFLSCTDRILLPYSSPLLANYGMFFSLMMAGILISILIDHQIPWQMIFFLFMPLSILLVVTNKPYLIQNKIHTAILPINFQRYKAFYKNIDNLTYISLQMALHILLYVFMLWAPIFLVDRLKHTLLSTGIIATLWFLCFIFGRIVFDILTLLKKNLWDPPAQFFIISLVSIFLMLITNLLFIDSHYLLVLTGLSCGYLFPLLSTLIHTYYGTSFSECRSIIYLTCVVLLIIIHLLSGLIAQVISLRIAFLMIPLFSAIFLSIAFFLGKGLATDDTLSHP